MARAEDKFDDDILYEPFYRGQTIFIGDYPNGPVEKVRELLARKSGGAPVFSEMFMLEVRDGEEEKNFSWFEVARWIKFEETVEEGGKRWSKPHISLLNLSAILQLRNCLKKGLVLLDIGVTDFVDLVDILTDQWNKTLSPQLDPVEMLAVEDALLSSKHHLVKSALKAKFASHKELAQIPKNQSSDQLTADGNGEPTEKSPMFKSKDSEGDLLAMEEPHAEEAKKVDKGASGSVNTGLMKKLPANSEAATIFIGPVEELTRPLCAFLRLEKPKTFGGVTEAPIPLRFVFVLLVPPSHTEHDELLAIGRALGCLMVDDAFSQVCYKAQDSTELCYGIDEFLSNIYIIPAGKWNPECRLEPSDTPVKKRITTDEKFQPVKKRTFSITRRGHGPDTGLRRTGRFCGGFISDIRRKAPFFLSDFKDAFSSVSALSQCLAAALFLFFANITNIITFGGVIEKMLDKQIGTIENLFSGALTGVVFALFSGQPLNILSATGPMLVFESILYKFCLERGWNFLASRFWVGAWSVLFTLIAVATDGSFIVALITKFSEESFASLISIVFIIEAFQQLAAIGKSAPLTLDPTAVLNSDCLCNVSGNSSFWQIPNLLIGNDSNGSDLYFDNFDNIVKVNSTEECKALQGVATGISCNFQPDVFLWSILLFAGAFCIAFGLKHFRTTGYLPTVVRRVLSDFSVLLAIIIMTGISVLVGVKTPSLNVPTSFEPTIPRNWIINPFDNIEWYVILLCGIPSIFFTILVFMDQQITCVIVNRKDNKLKKGYGYHLDFLLVGILIFICSLLGLPFYVAATVISIMHVEALKMMAEHTAPGEKPQFLGVREQRVTGILAGLLVGSAVFITPVIKLVPLPVLLGLFLYMGVVSLAGQQLTERVLLFLMPPKYQPDLLYLRLVPLKRVHLFTLIQIVGLVLLFAIKSFKLISMLFPVMLIVMVGIRKLMEKIFTNAELIALDHPLPTWKELVSTAVNRKISEGEFRRQSRKTSRNPDYLLSVKD